MDIHAYKIHAIKKHKRQQFVKNVLLYALSTVTCTLFCSSPLWYPPFCATFNVVFFLWIPKLCSFFTSKVLFIVGNLIVIFLMGESKFFASKSKPSTGYDNACYASKSPKSPEIHAICPPQERETGICESFDEKKTCESYDEEKFYDSHGEEKVCESKGVDEEDLEGDEELSLPAEELNKLADDFIARINRQRSFEAKFCRG